MRTTSLVVGIAWLALIAACAGAPSGSSGGGSWDEPVVVQFTDRSVDPAVARVAAGGNVRWVNIAQEIAGSVVFPESMAASFRCGPDLRPMFRNVGGRYQSLRIEGTMGASRVTLPCALDPGSYDYEIWLFGAGLGVETTSALPQNKLAAKLIVEQGEAGK